MLEWSLDESQLLYEERNNVAYYLAGRSQGRILLWNHLRQHWNNTLLGWAYVCPAKSKSSNRLLEK